MAWALSADTMKLLATAAGDPFQHIGKEGGIRSLTGIAAHLLVVENRQHWQALAGLGSQKALHAAEHALEIVQPGRDDELSTESRLHRLGPGIKKQFRGQKMLLPDARSLSDELPEGPRLLAAAQQGQQVHRRIQHRSLVDSAVHVDCHAGDHQQVPVDIHQPG